MKTKQTCAYLYADGHAVILHEQTVKLGGSEQEIEHAVIHEKFTKAHLSFTGRLCFSRYGSAALLDLCKRATQIKATENSLENGSDSTRKLGVAVGSLTFDFPDGSYLRFVSLDCLSGQFTYQPENGTKFDWECSTWGNARVSKIHRVTVPVAA